MKTNQLIQNNFLVTSIFKPLKMVKSGPLINQSAKLGKVSRDT